jgi:hypothetical protein
LQWQFAACLSVIYDHAACQNTFSTSFEGRGKATCVDVGITASLGLTNISGTAEIAVYNGGSLWADCWIETIPELRGGLKSSGKVNDALVDRFLAHCADSNWWTQTIAFTAVHSRTRDG